MIAILRVAILTALLAASVAAQQPVEPPAPPEVPRTRLRGRVVDARSNLPVKGARVVLGDRSEASAETETDFEGRFDMPDALTGERSIDVHKSAYAVKRLRIRIPVGRELEGVRIEMHRTAVITGRVTDAGGSPLAGAEVRVVHRVYSEGVPTYVPSASRMFGGATTDDRGWFRAWGLMPGAYIVTVVPMAEPGPRGETVFSASGLYYPNARSVAEAARVRVDWEQVHENIDLELGPPANTRVDGIVRFADGGGDCQNCMGELHRKEGDAWVQLGHATISRGGAFSISGLSPGHYALPVQSFVMRTSSMTFGVAELDVLDGQATPVVVDLHGEQKVSGRIVLEDPPETVVGPDAEPWRVAINFRERSSDPLTTPNNRGSFANVTGEGAETEFEVAPVAGRQVLQLMGAPAGGYVRDISIDGLPLEDTDITVPVGGLKDLVVSIAFDAGKVAGRVKGGGSATVDAGLLPPTRIVWLIPEGGHARFVENRITRSTQPDGSFEIDGLPPGTYRAYAVPEDTGRLMYDPATAPKLANWSHKVEIKPGQTTNLNLELAPILSSVE